MRLFNLYGFGIFWTLAIADALLIFKEVERYRVFTKPFLVLVILLTVFATISRRKNTFFKSTLAIALLFAAAGDILLLNAAANSTNFKIGIACIMLTHLLFAIYFLKVYPISITKPASAFFTFVIMSGLSIWLTIFLKPYLVGLFFPAIIYGIILSLMLSAAVNMLHSSTMSNKAIETFIPGALLFILSDFMLVINSFYFEEQVINAAVMLTYCGALFYLAKGFIKHLHKRSRKAKPEVSLG